MSKSQTVNKVVKLVACENCENEFDPQKLVASQVWEGATICVECAKTEDQWQPIED